MFDPATIAAKKRAANAKRARRSPARRRAGFRTVRLDLPAKKIERAIRARNHLPDHAPISQQLRDRLLVRCIDGWVNSWLAHLKYRRK